MSALFISLLTLVLILISAFVVLLVLMQRTSQSGGMGAALGGGAAESAFGSDTTNILTKGTIYGIIAFFLVALGLFLLYQAEAADKLKVISAEELISAEVVEEAVTADLAAGPTSEPMETSVVETVEAAVDASEGTIEAAVESVEVEAPALDVKTSPAETAPTSN